MNLNDENKGFTLVELMITLAILTLIVVISVPTFANITDNAEDSADEISVDNVEHAASIADAAGLAHDLERGYSVEYLSDNGYIDVKGSKMDHESSKVELYGHHYYFSSENGIGGRNLLKNSNDFKHYTAYTAGGRKTTREVVNDQNLEIPEWGAKDASRLRFTVNNNPGDFSYYLTTTPQLRSQNLAVVTYSYYIKNMGDEPFTVRYNGFGASDKVGFDLQPGEARQVSATGKMRENYDWFQHQFTTTNHKGVVDVALWRAQLEYGDTATPWRPAPEDLE